MPQKDELRYPFAHLSSVANRKSTQFQDAQISNSFPINGLQLDSQLSRLGSKLSN
jgi:hypothetical protein